MRGFDRNSYRPDYLLFFSRRSNVVWHVHRKLCTGEAGTGKVYKKPLHYKNSIFHRIIPQVCIQYNLHSRPDSFNVPIPPFMHLAHLIIVYFVWWPPFVLPDALLEFNV